MKKKKKEEEDEDLVVHVYHISHPSSLPPLLPSLALTQIINTNINVDRLKSASATPVRVRAVCLFLNSILFHSFHFIPNKSKSHHIASHHITTYQIKSNQIKSIQF